jgi:hypothetical protein
MKRSHALALSGLALFLASSATSHAQAIRPSQQCQPAVANASMYGNCRLHIVRGAEVCRCAILPQALRRLSREDRDAVATGAIGTRAAQGVSPAGLSGFSGRTATGAAVSGSALGAAAAAPSASGSAVAASSGSNRTGSASVSGGGGNAAGAFAGSVADSASGRSSSGSDNGRGNGPGNNNGLGNGSEPADNSSTDVKGSDPSNPGNGGGNAGGGGKGGNGGSGDSNGGGKR